jgi:membrane protease YdiL (CAAX protease family)
MIVANALVRAIVFWISFIALLFVTGSALHLFLDGEVHRLIYGLAGTAVALLCTWFWSNRQKQSLDAYGLNWRAGSLVRAIKGFVLGALIMVLVLLALLLFTPLEIKAAEPAFSASSLFWFLGLIPFAYLEEAAFRGMPFVELHKKYGLLMAQFIVALAFAVYHLIYGWPIQVAFMGPFVWSFVFGLARVHSNGIALPTGMHVALNAGQILLGMKPESVSLFSLDVSGAVSRDMQSRIDMTGILIQIAVLVIALLFSFLYTRRKADIAG